MKNTKLSPWLIALATLPLLTACGSSGSSKSDPAPAQHEPPRVPSITSGVTLTSNSDDTALIGDWTSKCGAGENLSSFTVQMSFKETHVIQTMNLYQDGFCTSPLMSMNILMTYSAQSNNVAFVSQRATTILRDSAVARTASQGNSCGFNKWLAGVEYDITNLNCPKTQNGISFTGNQAGTRADGSYSISGNQLTLGGEVLTRTSSPRALQEATPWSQTPGGLLNGISAGFTQQ